MASRGGTDPEPGRRADLQGGVYGTILATALVAAYSTDESLSGGEVAAGVEATVLVFWLAHAYAGLVAGGLSGSGALSVAAVRRSLSSEWPIVASSGPIVFALLLAPLGVLGVADAETVALAVGVVILVGYGVLIGIRRGLNPLGVVALACANGLFGLAIVALKALVH